MCASARARVCVCVRVYECMYRLTVAAVCVCWGRGVGWSGTRARARSLPCLHVFVRRYVCMVGRHHLHRHKCYCEYSKMLTQRGQVPYNYSSKDYNE